MRLLAALLLITAGAAPTPERIGNILIFSHTSGYRHESIPAGIRALERLARKRGLTTVASEDPAIFASPRLSRFRAIVLLSTTTDPKKPASEWFAGAPGAGLRNFVENGGGVVAIHAAADSHYHWPWYGRLIGGRFASHPNGTPTGMVSLVDPAQPLNRGLPRTARRTDEWYYFDDFDPKSTLLVTLDPASINQPDVNPNPAAWARRVGRARVFYTAMGHTTESYSEPYFLRHLGNGLDWVLAGSAKRKS